MLLSLDRSAARTHGQPARLVIFRLRLRIAYELGFCRFEVAQKEKGATIDSAEWASYRSRCLEALKKEKTAPNSGERMMWKKPKVIEIAVGLEINSYACAVVS